MRPPDRVWGTAHQKRTYDLKARPPQFAINDFVWRWYLPSANRKLAKGWTGPYKVVGCPGPLNCQIQRERDGRIVRVHVDHLKLYHGDTPPGWDESESSEPGSDEDTTADPPLSNAVPSSDVPSAKDSISDRDPERDASEICTTQRCSRR